MFRQMKVIVEVSPELAAGMSDSQRARLARGLSISSCYRGIRIDGFQEPQILDTLGNAVMFLLNVSATERALSLSCGGQETATGLWRHDRAEFFRLAAEALFSHQNLFWPA